MAPVPHRREATDAASKDSDAQAASTARILALWWAASSSRGIVARRRRDGPSPSGLESDVADIPSLQQKAVDFAKRGDFGADARAVNEELTQLSPENEGAWTRLARCCLEAGQLAAASGALESALLVNPQNNLARSLLQEVIRRELLAEPVQEPAPARPRKSRTKKAPVEEE